MEIEWIPTKERKPDKVGRYLCTYQGSVKVDIFTGWHFGHFYNSLTKDLCTAWAKVPKPYTADDPGDWTPLNEGRPVTAPGESNVYLCTWADGEVLEGHYIDGHFRLYGENVDQKITAWMKMPEPYKEVRDD